MFRGDSANKNKNKKKFDTIEDENEDEDEKDETEEITESREEESDDDMSAVSPSGVEFEDKSTDSNPKRNGILKRSKTKKKAAIESDTFQGKQ